MDDVPHGIIELVLVVGPLLAWATWEVLRRERGRTPMTDNTALLSGLNLFTLVAVLLILIASFAYFLRKRRNRIAASHVFGIDDTKPDSRRSS